MDEYDKALKYALSVLNRKDYTIFEMNAKLESKGYNEDVNNRVISYLIDKNFLNDERYVENYLYFRLKSGYGINRIRYELSKRGIDQALLDAYLNEIDELEAAASLFDNKIEVFRTKENGRQKMYSFFERRGFSYDTINRLLNNKKGMI
jgi:regulatory protein